MNRTCAKALGLACVTAILLAGPMTAWAQPARTDLAQQWNDFIHYIRIARPDAALANARAILQSDPDPAAVYRNAAQTPDLLDVLARGERFEELAEPIGQLRQVIEMGYRQERMAADNIARAIDLLGGNLRQYQMGQNQLEASGEYAVPQMIQRLSDPRLDLMLRDRMVTVLPRLGRPAVRPLAVALEHAEPEVREVVARTLGQIGYAHAAPFLKARVEDANELESVRQASRTALVAVAGQDALRKSQASLFHELAERYYTDEESVRPDLRRDTANLWFWQDGLGVTYIEVPLAIFNDVHAMQAARRALQADESFYPAVSLWLAANIRKEANLPAGLADPTRGPTQVDARAYAKAAGAQYAQEVLTRALRDRDVAVALGIIEPLGSVLGAQNLADSTAGGVNPLVRALSFPNRRVRFLAADALTSARPLRAFIGSDLVMNVVVEALRQTGQPSALVIEPDQTRRNSLQDMLRQAGYTVVAGADFGGAVSAARQASGVDVVVVSASIRGPGLTEAMGLLRADAMLAPLPVIVLAGEAELHTARTVARDDALVQVIEAVRLNGELAERLEQARAQLVGEMAMSSEEADYWALSAANAIRMLGLTRNPVYDITRAEAALVASLSDPRNVQKVAAANALSVVPTGSAQQAIIALAGQNDLPEEVRIAAYDAAAESVRLIGNQLTDAQARAVVEVVGSEQASLALRDAASQVLGALNLPSQQIRVLITSSFSIE